MEQDAIQPLKEGPLFGGPFLGLAVSASGRKRTVNIRFVAKSNVCFTLDTGHWANITMKGRY